MNVAATLPVILRLHIGGHDVLSAGDEKRSRQHLSGTAYSLKYLSMKIYSLFLFLESLGLAAVDVLFIAVPVHEVHASEG